MRIVLILICLIFSSCTKEDDLSLFSIIQASSSGGTITPSMPLFDVNEANAQNAPNKLALPASDGQNQMMHFHVTEFDAPFKGYDRAGAGTPFTGNDNQVENPEPLFYDGANWIVLPGTTNPIQPTPASPTAYWADTNILLGYDGRLYVFYRGFSEPPTATAYYTYMQHIGELDADWSSQELVISRTLGGGAGLLSPSMIKDKDLSTGLVDVYALYDIDFDFDGTPTGTTSTLRRNEGVPTGSLGVPTSGWTTQDCTFTNVPTDRYPWHIWVSERLENGQYIMMVSLADYSPGSNTDLYMAISTDGLEFVLGNNPIIARGSGGWDNTRIYTGSGIFINDPSNYRFEMFYSAESGNVWGTGQTNLYLTPQG